MGEPIDDLRRKYQASGLQAIAKLVTIPLTPSNPSLPSGHWQVEGQLNERILTTLLYCVESHNVITPSISFRVPTHPSLPEYHHWFEEDAPWEESLIERLYGMSLSLAKESTWDTTSRRAQTKRAEWSENVKYNNASGRGTLPVQNHCHVDIKQGRMIAWPNTMHHRFSGIQLQDKTRPGKMSFVQVSLVNPEQRIVSTANVPPRRGDWFGDALFQSGKDWEKVSKKLTGLLIEQGAEVPIGCCRRFRTLGAERKTKLE